MLRDDIGFVTTSPHYDRDGLLDTVRNIDRLASDIPALLQRDKRNQSFKKQDLNKPLGMSPATGRVSSQYIRSTPFISVDAVRLGWGAGAHGSYISKPLFEISPWYSEIINLMK